MVVQWRWFRASQQTMQVAEPDVATARIKNQVMDAARLEAAREVKKIEEKARNQAEGEARRIISMAVQRLASSRASRRQLASSA